MSFGNLTTGPGFAQFPFSRGRERNGSANSCGLGAFLGIAAQRPKARGVDAELPLHRAPEGTNLSAERHNVDSERPDRREFISALKANFGF